MFKLIKINHAKNNCPEFVKMRAMGADAVCNNGCIVKRDEDTVTIYDNGKPDFIVVGNYDTHKDLFLTAYPVTREMVFEVRFKGDIDNVHIGSNVQPASFNDDGAFDSVEFSETGCGRILNIKEHENYILVDVMFDER